MKTIADWRRAALTFPLLALTASCGDDGQGELTKLRDSIATASAPTTWVATTVANGVMQVEAMLPPKTDPLEWRPSREDFERMRTGKLIFLAGAEFESWSRTTSLPKSRTVWLASSQNDQFLSVPTVMHSHGDGPAHTHAGTNPYVWLDPAMFKAQAKIARERIYERFPSKGETLDAGLAKAEAALDGLDRRWKELAPKLKAATIYSVHPVYGYVARSYGFELLSVKLPDEATEESVAAAFAEHGDAPASGPRLLFTDVELDATTRTAVEANGVRIVSMPSCAHGDKDYITMQNDVLDGLARELNK